MMMRRRITGPPHISRFGGGRDSRQGLTRGAGHLGLVGSGKAVHPIAQAVAQARTDFGQVCNKNTLLAFLLLRVSAFIHGRRIMLIGNPQRSEKRIMPDHLGLSALLSLRQGFPRR